MKLNVVVLAAGLGTRMCSEIPKVLHPLAGRPLLEHVLDTVSCLDPHQTIVVSGHGHELVRDAFSDHDIIWATQSEQLGTGHAVMQALDYLDADARVLILLGDVPLISAETLQHLIHSTDNNDLGMLTADMPDPTGFGRIYRDENGQVIEIIEERDASPEVKNIKEINAGIFLASALQLNKWLPKLGDDNSQGEYYLTDIVPMALQYGQAITALKAPNHWETMGINDQSQLAEVERYFQRQQAERLMREGVRFSDPTRFDLRGECQAGSDVSIDINVILEGEVRIGSGASIGPNCVISNSVIGENTVIRANAIIEESTIGNNAIVMPGSTIERANIAEGVTIKANSVIEDASIGANAQIGPFARLRPGSDIQSDAKIGNFVEIKNSTVGKGSKINHLSYIGDTVIGEDANIGAGTITCNYDGVNKHQTTIGDRAFIGSNTQLVAPVTIGDDAVIGAGSTITEDAPPTKTHPKPQQTNHSRPLAKARKV